MPGITIMGTGSYVPDFSLTNKMLESVLDTADEWITLRTGIKSRRIAAEHETVLSMAVKAANKALEGIDRSRVGVVVAASISPDYHTPSTSCLMQRELGLPGDVLAIDINCACAGFVVAINMVRALLADMPGRIAVVAGCEILSRVMDYTDRASCVLFGDGASAAVIGLNPDGQFYFDSGAKGDDEMLVITPSYHSNNPFIAREAESKRFGIKMDGPAVFKFAIESSSASIKRIAQNSGIQLGDVDQFVLHQANRRIIEGIIKKLHIESDKCLINIDGYGNTSSATCGIVLDELNRADALKPGCKIMMSAFGGGMIYASAYFTQGVMS